MKFQSSCKMPNRRKINLALLAVALLLALLGFSPRVRASDTAPDWLRAAAQDKVPDYPKEAVVVVLLNDQQTIVSANGQIESRTRRAYKILRPEAERHYSYAGATFDDQTKVSFFRAWTITSDGHELEVKDKDAVVKNVTSFELFSDVRAEYLRFPEVKPGSVVGYELVQKQRPDVFDDIWFFQDDVPIRRSRY